MCASASEISSLFPTKSVRNEQSVPLASGRYLRNRRLPLAHSPLYQKSVGYELYLLSSESACASAICSSCALSSCALSSLYVFLASPRSLSIAAAACALCKTLRFYRASHRYIPHIYSLSHSCLVSVYSLSHSSRDVHKCAYITVILFHCRYTQSLALPETNETDITL